MNLLAALFMVQLLFIVGVGGVQVNITLYFIFLNIQADGNARKYAKGIIILLLEGALESH